MRLFGCCSIGLLAVALAASGQGVAQPSGQENLDGVLRAWEKSMTDLKNFTCVVEREDLDKALQIKDMSKGYAMFLKAANPKDGSRAKLHMQNIRTKMEEKYICTGVFIYEYVAAQKLIRVHKMPKDQQGGGQESFLSFLFGMGAKEAKDRYQMELIVPKAPDKFYHYLRVLPKLPQDKGDFTEARLSLLRANNLPAQIWYHQPNGKEITWNFTELKVDLPNLPVTYFDPDNPNRWRTEWAQPKAPVAAQPNVIRNSSN
jgi:TIGR03009 family protein